jgi:hypothetical protein
MAARFRNSKYLIGRNIYFGVDIAYAYNGHKRIDVMYALVYRVDGKDQYKVFNRVKASGENLPIYLLGQRLDKLDKEMGGIGFTWRGDTFGAVIKDAVKRYRISRAQVTISIL